MRHNGVMLDNRDAQALDAAKLYYVSSLSQAEVAAQLGVSRPTVSKLLAYAREQGFVTISINDPRESSDEVVEQMRLAFGLKTVRVVRPVGETKDELLSELGNAGAALLEDMLHDGMSVGLSWGTTMLSVSEHMRKLDLSGMKVVQLKGGHSHSSRSTSDMVTLTRMARALNAEVSLLPMPVILDNKQAFEIVTQDRHIKEMLNEGANVDVALFTVGDVSPENLVMNLGLMGQEESEKLMARAIGDACSRFYDVNGDVAVKEIDERTVAIRLEELRSRPARLLVAGGESKVQAITVALRMGLATHLVIDIETAQRVLREDARGADPSLGR